MDTGKINISLKLLLLNDLLRAKAIDQDIYDRAVKKIEGTETESQAA